MVPFHFAEFHFAKFQITKTQNPPTPDPNSNSNPNPRWFGIQLILKFGKMPGQSPQSRQTSNAASDFMTVMWSVTHEEYARYIKMFADM